MNTGQGSPSQNAKEDTDTEEPKDMSAEKGYKAHRSLPFSVESLIAKKTTCRTSYSPSDLALNKSGAPPTQQQIPQRTFYSDRKAAAESVHSASSNSKDDSAQFNDKDQSTWFQTASFSSPPRKSLKVQNKNKLQRVDTLKVDWWQQGF